MNPGNRVPLPVGELFKLKVGDKFVVYWAKDDDDAEYLRLDFETQTIAETDGTSIHTKDDYEWDRGEIIKDDENTLNTSRGYAFFFRAEQPVSLERSMKHPFKTLKYVVVETNGDYDLSYDSFGTYDEAINYVEDTDNKCLIIGPEGIEDHT